MSARFDRLDAMLAAAFGLGFGLFAALGLGYLPESLFDEIYVLPAARAIADGQAPIEQTHPPLSKLLMAVGFMAVRGTGHGADWGAVALGCRLAAIVAGSLCLVGLYLLVRAIADRRTPAVVAASLLALDGAFYVLARAAMTNVFAALFVIWGVLCTWLAASRERTAWLWPAGISFGLAVACRHTAAIPLAICLVYALRNRVTALVALGVVPVLVYAATYLQTIWAVTGLNARGAALFVALQRYSIASHAGYSVPNVNASPWWSWPLMLAPPWFSFGVDLAHDKVYPVLLVGNALVWWAAVPAMAYAGYQAVRRRDAAMGLLAALALVPWLAWGALSSNASLMHYFFESIPAVCAILGLAVGRLPRAAVVGYLGLAVAWAAFYHPLQTNAPLPIAEYARRLPPGLESWDLARRTKEFRARNHLEDPKAYQAFLERNYPSFKGYLETNKDFPVR